MLSFLISTFVIFIFLLLLQSCFEEFVYLLDAHIVKSQSFQGSSVFSKVFLEKESSKCGHSLHPLGRNACEFSKLHHGKKPHRYVLKNISCVDPLLSLYSSVCLRVPYGLSEVFTLRAV